MNAREQRGIDLAERVRIQPVGKGIRGIWMVPSATHPATRYTVNLNSTAQRCTCPDYATRRCNCKHVFAVKHYVRRQSVITEVSVEVENGTATVTAAEVVTTTTVKRKTYRQNWPVYNMAQTTEKHDFQLLLRNLCNGIESPKQEGRGRARLPLADMVFASTFKVYSTVSTRRFMCDMADARDKGYVTKAPHYNSIINYIESEELTPILHDLIRKSAEPLTGVEQDFAVDSTGFSGSKFTTWFHEKYDADRIEFMQEYGRTDWVKLHLMTGTKTNIVSSVEVSDRYSNDSPYLKPLVNRTVEAGFTMREVSADKAYLSRENLNTIAAHGAAPYIPFKVNSQGGSVTGSNPNKATTADDLWLSMWRYFTFRTEEFLTHYHKRSNIESTFHMIKAKFGHSVRAKTRTAQINEVLLKVLCHNIVTVAQSIHELGIEADFANGFRPNLASCTKSQNAAQQISMN